MKVSHTPDGIPVVELTMADLAGPEPAGLTAAVDQIAAAALATAAVASRKVPTIPGKYVHVIPGTGFWDLPVYSLAPYGHWHDKDGNLVTLDRIARMDLERVVAVRLVEDTITREGDQ